MMQLEPYFPVFVVLEVVAFLHVAVGLSLMLRWRNVFPIAGRKMIFVVMPAIALLSWTTFDSLGGILGATPCAARLVFIHVALYVLITSYLTRFVRLWFEYFASCEKIDLKAAAAAAQAQSEKDSNSMDASQDQGAVAVGRASEWTSRWFSDRRHYVKTRNLMKVFLLLVSVEAGASIASFVVASRDPAFEAVSDLCPSLSVSLFIFSGCAAVSTFLGFYTALKLRGIEDGFGIKNEIKWAACAGVYNMVVGNVLRTIVTADNSDIFRGLVWLGNQAFLFVLVTQPVLQAYRHQKLLRRSAKKKRRPRRRRAASGSKRSRASGTDDDDEEEMSLKKVLDDCDYRAQFIEHLKQEFAVENILFYEDAKQFFGQCQNNAFASNSERTRRAVELYAEYMAPDAPLEVNLGNIIRKKIISTLCHCIPNFDPVKPHHNGTCDPMDIGDGPGSTPLAPHMHRAEESSSAATEQLEIPANTFEDARSAIYRLMHQDSFVRFKQQHLELHESVYRLATIEVSCEKSRTMTRVSKPRDEEISLYENTSHRHNLTASRSVPPHEH